MNISCCLNARAKNGAQHTQHSTCSATNSLHNTHAHTRAVLRTHCANLFVQQEMLVNPHHHPVYPLVDREGDKGFGFSGVGGSLDVEGEARELAG